MRQKREQSERERGNPNPEQAEHLQVCKFHYILSHAEWFQWSWEGEWWRGRGVSFTCNVSISQEPVTKCGATGRKCAQVARSKEKGVRREDRVELSKEKGSSPLLLLSLQFRFTFWARVPFSFPFRFPLPLSLPLPLPLLLPMHHFRYMALYAFNRCLHWKQFILASQIVCKNEAAMSRIWLCSSHPELLSWVVLPFAFYVFKL